jgi:undecaprenyl-diphosphatase
MFFSMSSLTALFLGIVQGITEFLPISSSGHLALLEHYLKVEGGGLTFDIILHMGSLLALLVYFSSDWQDMARALWRPTFKNRPERRLAICLAVATIPGALAGVILEKKAETLFRQPLRVAFLMAALGLLLILGEKLARHRRTLSSLGLREGFFIGLSQALAIMPGVSRSGITMTTGLLLGFNRETAARFSFLLATPIIAGSGFYKLLKSFFAAPPSISYSSAIWGFLAAVVSSYLAIRYLLQFLRNHTFIPFAVYRLVLAGLVVILEIFWH